MKKPKNKKAMFFNIIIVLGFFGIMLFAFVVLNNKQNQFSPRKLGERQFKIIEAYAEGENALFYIDQAAKISAQQTIYEMARNGSFYGKSSCGSYLGYNLWSNKVNDNLLSCYPEPKAVETNFGAYMDEQLKGYRESYPNAYLQSGSYDYKFYNNLKLIGIIKETAVLQTTEIGPEKEKEAEKMAECSKGMPKWTWPVSGSPVIISCFGQRWGRLHAGIDIGSSRQGTMGDQIYAVADGTVRRVSSSCPNSPQKACGGGYGNHIIITHDNDKYTTIYAHLMKEEITVAQGAKVKAGDKIGKMGNSGTSTGVHLHFGVYLTKENPAASYLEGSTNPICFFDLSGLNTNGKQCSEQNLGGETEINYEIYPNFKVELDYHISDYDELNKRSVEMVNECQEAVDIVQCAKDKINEYNALGGLEWEISGCEKGAERFFYELAGSYQECLESEDTGCFCEFELDSGIGKGYENSEHNIFLMPNNQATDFIYGNLKETLPMMNSYQASHFAGQNMHYNVEFDSKGDIEKAYVDTDSKITIKDGKVYIIKEDASSIVYSEDKPNLKECKIKPKKLKFCAKHKKDTGYEQVWAYDEQNPILLGKIALRDVVYKFALYFENPPPPKITNLNVEDKQKAENSIVLTWPKTKEKDGSDVSDLLSYNVYCSLDDFGGDVSALLPVLSVYPDPSVEEITVDLSKCRKSDNKYGAIKDNSGPYYITVTSLDTALNEIKSDLATVAADSTKPDQNGPYDDLAPGLIIDLGADTTKMNSYKGCINLLSPLGILLSWSQPDYNEDSKTPYAQENIGESYLYYQEGDYPRIGKCTPGKNCMKIPAQKTEATVVPDLATFVLGDEYCFIILAVDKYGNYMANPDSGFKEPEQWSKLVKDKGHYSEDGKSIEISI